MLSITCIKFTGFLVFCSLYLNSSWQETPWSVKALRCLLYYYYKQQLTIVMFTSKILHVLNMYTAHLLPWSLHHLSQVCSTKQLYLQNIRKINFKIYWIIRIIRVQNNQSRLDEHDNNYQCTENCCYPYE